MLKLLIDIVSGSVWLFIMMFIIEEIIDKISWINRRHHFKLSDCFWLVKIILTVIVVTIFFSAPFLLGG